MSRLVSGQRMPIQLYLLVLSFFFEDTSFAFDAEYWLVLQYSILIICMCFVCACRPRLEQLGDLKSDPSDLSTSDPQRTIPPYKQPAVARRSPSAVQLAGPLSRASASPELSVRLPGATISPSFKDPEARDERAPLAKISEGVRRVSDLSSWWYKPKMARPNGVQCPLPLTAWLFEWWRYSRHSEERSDRDADGGGGGRVCGARVSIVRGLSRGGRPRQPRAHSSPVSARSFLFSGHSPLYRSACHELQSSERADS